MQHGEPRSLLATSERRPVTICRRTLNLPYRAEDVFDLISDVRRYPEFVKWLRRLTVISEQTHENGWKGRAETTVGFGGLSETFTTDIDAVRSSLTVDVALVRGPLRRLTNRWRITPTPTGSTVDFQVDFEFRNFLLQALAEETGTSPSSGSLNASCRRRKGVSEPPGDLPSPAATHPSDQAIIRRSISRAVTRVRRRTSERPTSP